MIAEGFCAPDKIVAYGGSAGGMLMGAVANLRPDLWAGIIAAKPAQVVCIIAPRQRAAMQR